MRGETSEGNERIERAKAVMMIRGPSWKLELGEIGILVPVQNSLCCSAIGSEFTNIRDLIKPELWTYELLWIINQCRLTVTHKRKKAQQHCYQYKCNETESFTKTILHFSQSCDDGRMDLICRIVDAASGDPGGPRDSRRVLPTEIDKTAPGLTCMRKTGRIEVNLDSFVLYEKHKMRFPRLFDIRRSSRILHKLPFV